ncbi:Pimeloyl-ACP methyl ester carboxylesterase [Cnuella takakiae]|uniref:Pimeloyl-ACP methyl ester carboxylesterase n=1 Tax=Cnuella takakiae TaxID=1302690 RepID=A0A1M5EF17_9BACT|nr:alpha/beta hydrolase [Cnuella takakiae]OLY94639.1 alpha/beta hydrolase [Cnuella takakiae]SHF77815.1 Pimeloyl-ACP methyl ester carboxylesterase [Cnuella takakiae]
MKRLICCFLSLLLVQLALAQTTTYPHPVRYLQLTNEQLPARMAYMDVQPAQPNGRSVLLLHGKNFNGYYWKEVIASLQGAGFRVVVPDQVGWGFSDKPNIHYSFHLLADNTRKLLDSLGIAKIIVVGHSMGGMLATRFALMFPERVEKLVYENPIGLEDYRSFVPYTALDKQFASELNASMESLRKYQQSYYPQWQPQYDQYVQAQYAALQIPNFKEASWASALASQMIYEQPVVYEFKNITAPTLLIIGQEDRTIVGKALLSKEVAAQHGNYPQLGKWLHKEIKGSKLVELKGIGHIPHIQALADFNKALLGFLNAR